MMRLILFDIDGTLINSGGIGRAAMGHALRDVFGTAGTLDTYEFAGQTDQRIVSDLMAAEGWSEADVEARLPRFYERMAAAGEALFSSAHIRPCPGVLDLLEELARREDVALALLTANIRHTAPLKLAAAGIRPEQFRFGAYGCDSRERNALFDIALNRAETALGARLAAGDVTIIGDTPADIHCARAGGGQAIAVATGPYAANILTTHRPDYLFDDLSHTEEVLRAILSPGVGPG